MTVQALDPAGGRRTKISFAGRSFEIAGDAPVAHGGADEGPNGFDLIAAALGHCFLVTLLQGAEERRAGLQGARVTVASKSLLEGSGRAPVIDELRIDVDLEGDVDPAAAEELLGYAAQLCGVHATLRRPPRIDAHVHLGTTSAR